MQDQDGLTDGYSFGKQTCPPPTQ